MNFFGLLTFQAPYLPYVLLGFSLLLGNSVSVDLLGKKWLQSWITKTDGGKGKNYEVTKAYNAMLGFYQFWNVKGLSL